MRAEQDSACEEVEVVVRYRSMDASVRRILAAFQSLDTRIKCSDSGMERFVCASEVFYAESVDKRTFLYLEKEVLRTDLRLYQLAEALAHAGFVQVSKSCILNIHALSSIRPLMNSRMEATLKNGEKIHVNRKYVSAIKEALQGGCGR